MNLLEGIFGLLNGGKPNVAAPAPMLGPNDASPLDNAAWPAGPTDSPMNANGQIAAPLSLAPPARGGGFLDKINDNSNMLLGLAGGLAGGRGWGDAISRASQGMAAGSDLDRRANGQSLTEQALVRKGLDPSMARAVASNPALMSSVAGQMFRPQVRGLTATEKTQFGLPDGPWMIGADSKPFLPDGLKKLSLTGAAADPTEYGLNPVYGKDAQGNDVLGVLGKDGTFKQVDTGGVKLSSGVEKVDLGTYYQLRDKRTGQVVGMEKKDIAGAKREGEIGEAQGKAVAAAPGDIQAGKTALDILDQVEKHPGLNQGTGLTSKLNGIPGTSGYDFQNLVDQAKGGAFLQAIQQMRGLGSLSNAEGGAATAAVTRMNTATSKEGFLAGLSDYRKIVQQGIARAEARLKNPDAINPAAAPAAVEDLLKKYGS